MCKPPEDVLWNKCLKSTEMEHIKQLKNVQMTFSNLERSDVSFIKTKLKALKNTIVFNENAIYDALCKDFKKSKFETYFSEIGILISEIEMTIKNIENGINQRKYDLLHLIFPQGLHLQRALRNSTGYCSLELPFNWL